MPCCRQLRQKRRWLPICHAFRSMSRSCGRWQAKCRRRRSKLRPLRWRLAHPRRRSSMQRAPGLHNSCVTEQMSNLRTDPLRNLNRRRIVVRRRRRPLRCASPVRRVSLSARLPVVKHRRRRNPQHRRTAVLRRHSTAHRLRGRSACAPMPAVGRRRRRRRRPRCRRKERRRKLLRRRFRDRQNRHAMTGIIIPGCQIPFLPLMPLLHRVTPGRMFRRSNRPAACCRASIAGHAGGRRVFAAGQQCYASIRPSARSCASIAGHAGAGCAFAAGKQCCASIRPPACSHAGIAARAGGKRIFASETGCIAGA